MRILLLLLLLVFFYHHGFALLAAEGAACVTLIAKSAIAYIAKYTISCTFWLMVQVEHYGMTPSHNGQVSPAALVRQVVEAPAVIQSPSQADLIQMALAAYLITEVAAVPIVVAESEL
ncbi:hypothetical protein CDL15_Pgr022766 [Punica granatum]|uniref:Secreted protein n=1 Tax=Punica granatum TaxID=22663 RepID=A0A218XRR5_PUNGR|nr:hypothetical protein CDL15_Pgr022766 [Punica granatum]